MNVKEDPFSQEKNEEVSFEIAGYLKSGQTFGELTLLLKGGMEGYCHLTYLFVQHRSDSY